MREEIRAKLVEMGMDAKASDAEARAFAKAHNVEIVETANALSNEDVRSAYAAAAEAGCLDEAVRMVEEGKSLREIFSSILKKRSSKPAGLVSIGLSEKEKKQYSLRNVILAQLEHNDNLAGFEREVSDATAKAMGVRSAGFLLPLDILDSRDFTAGTNSTGGYTVPTVTLSMIDMIRNASVLDQLGATFLTGITGNIQIPRLVSGLSYYYVAEQSALTKSNGTFDQVSLSGKDGGAMTILSRQFLKQSSLGVEAFVRRELAYAIAQMLDNSALYGTGSNAQPTGIFNTTGINSVAIDTNGGAPTWAKIVAMETEVADDGVIDDGTMRYLFNPRTRGVLKTTAKASNTAAFIWENGEVNGYKAICSGTLKHNGTKGTGTNLSDALFGKFSDLIVALWGGLDVVADPYSGSSKGDVQVVGFQTHDIGVKHVESFCKCTDIVTA